MEELKRLICEVGNTLAENTKALTAQGEVLRRLDERSTTQEHAMKNLSAAMSGVEANTRRIAEVAEKVTDKRAVSFASHMVTVGVLAFVSIIFGVAFLCSIFWITQTKLNVKHGSTSFESGPLQSFSGSDGK